jgi:hypothetical protein
MGEAPSHPLTPILFFIFLRPLLAHGEAASQPLTPNLFYFFIKSDNGAFQMSNGGRSDARLPPPH